MLLCAHTGGKRYTLHSENPGNFRLKFAGFSVWITTSKKCRESEEREERERERERERTFLFGFVQIETVGESERDRERGLFCSVFLK
jgi:hypothetical protein